MGLEIERKFLVVNDAWRVNAVGVRYRQGYLSTVPERTVRVRTVGNQGFLTIKGITQGAARREYEYEIPLGDANEMLDGLCERPLIEKVRYKIPYGGLLWELDEFEGDNAGLLMADDFIQHLVVACLTLRRRVGFRYASVFQGTAFGSRLGAQQHRRRCQCA